ncbi:helix-turn-helix domain-containing protein [Saccharopolyspora phatthalungensis]|uniref:Transcriptional regulator with XRE-family HTH domain n=1 Tax=Saccharopolyspora phatthalungensis TaxID=664693 RepID=A0A840QBE1_9PSEU|nr:helix-turn-helix domain-containing protein [Saccharopolyspora phatthalungensis]MBB5155755.1 transcriptional regulator with XRE-family HTH domain [Saccharopolyspora phatthalungensis]
MSSNGPSVGARIRKARERAGMSRRVLGGLVNRSGEWVKAVETGRLQTPKLQMLTKLAHVLDVRDLAELTGNDEAVSVSRFAFGAAHQALYDVQAALTEYRLTPDTRPVDLAHLTERLAVAWKVRHSSPDHRTQLGALLPGLIRDAQRAVRVHQGAERRQARRILAGVYQLADFYVAFQPAPELVWLVADRAVTEGQEADDPYAMAAGAWALVQALRESGRWEEAISVAHDGAAQLEPYLESAPDDWHGMVGALRAENAITYARRGRHGEAWRYWESAHGIARKLGPGYRHVQTSFGLPVMKANAVTLGVELRRGGEAMQAANFDPAEIASVPRRARHMIEVARGSALQGNQTAVLAMLDRAERTAPETARFNGWARELAHSLLDRPPAGESAAVRSLAQRIGVR